MKFAKGAPARSGRQAPRSGEGERREGAGASRPEGRRRAPRRSPEGDGDHDGAGLRHLSHGARDAGDLRQARGAEAAIPRHHDRGPLLGLEHRLALRARARLPARRRRGGGAERARAARVARRASAARRLRKARRRPFPRPQPRPLSRGRGARDHLRAGEDHQVAAGRSAPTARSAKRSKPKKDAAHV